MDYVFNEDGRFVVLRIIDGDNIAFELHAEAKPSRYPATVQKRIAFGIPGVATFQVIDQLNTIIAIIIIQFHIHLV